MAAACLNGTNLVYDRNHYFGLGPKPKPKLAGTFDRYRKRYRSYILKGESSYPYHEVHCK